MTRLSDNLTTRRESLGLNVPQVHEALNLRGIDVAFSTVAGWFNGSRGVGDMDHLIALCEILQTDIDTMARGEIEVSEGSVAVKVARGLRQLNPTQQEAILAIIESMKGRDT